eukprot:TRINITY_DN12914_c1_g1_i1.p1 TRINITY_DN12914_c1_g1~~TRINITY_DN12914_c1_g1_i1.p1  ORF type:complete len:427 (+),score=150.59 TRINITY_DN12914_c1_g1_i1:42-1322(+)
MSKAYKIGIVGLGKLGKPVALGMSLKGHDVMGYDVLATQMQKDSFPHREIGPNGETSIEPLLQKCSLRFGQLNEVVAHAEIIFVAVQTPHEVEYEGITRIPETRKNFNYTWLKSACGKLADEIKKQGQDKVVIIISTVLPGTMQKEILPLLNDHVKICYNPFFIAMGTTIKDFYFPEFVLFGVVSDWAADKADKFYQTIMNAPFYRTSLENAEMIKVSYNTFIGMKIVFANVVMEICHKLPNVDVNGVTGALKLANRRLMSGAYMDGGMGDGGGCHPRDNIALSWLAQENNLSYDWYESVMVAREKQTEWLADLMLEHKDTGLPNVILGKSFKPETNLTVGSPAILLKNLLEEKNVKVQMYDPHVDGEEEPEFVKKAAIFFIGTKHATFAVFPFPQASIVLDPHRYIPEQSGVRVIAIGSAKGCSS